MLAHSWLQGFLSHSFISRHRKDFFFQSYKIMALLNAYPVVNKEDINNVLGCVSTLRHRASYALSGSKAD